MAGFYKLLSEYGRESGMVDPKFAIKIGKQLGANLIVIGTIVNIREQNKTFSGYGINTTTKVIFVTIRIRIIDIASSKVVFSKLIEDSKTYLNTDYGGITNSDNAFEVIKESINKLILDNQFIYFFSH